MEVKVLYFLDGLTTEEVIVRRSNEQQAHLVAQARAQNQFQQRKERVRKKRELRESREQDLWQETKDLPTESPEKPDRYAYRCEPMEDAYDDDEPGKPMIRSMSPPSVEEQDSKEDLLPPVKTKRVRRRKKKSVNPRPKGFILDGVACDN